MEMQHSALTILPSSSDGRVYIGSRLRRPLNIRGQGPATARLYSRLAYWSACYCQPTTSGFYLRYTYYPAYTSGVSPFSANLSVKNLNALPNVSVQRCSEINFLCVHKKLRSKRLAPVLIKEVTRRCNSMGIFQAIYTAGVFLPTPFSACQ